MSHVGTSSVGRTVLLYAVSSALVVGAVGAALWQPIALPLILGAALFVMIAARVPQTVSPLLLIAAIPFFRPNVLSNNYALVGTGLVIVGALIAVVADRLSTRVSRAYGFVAIGTLAMSCWQLVSASVFNIGDPGDVGKSFLTTGVTVAATGLILGNNQRRQILARIFVWLIVALGASYIVTVVIWRLLGFGAFTLGTFEISPGAPATVVFPFTITFGSLDVFGASTPRLTGLGREPGWMALYAGIALLIAPAVGRLRWWMIICLGAALLGAISTAGFGAFVVVVVTMWLFRSGRGDLFVTYLGFLVKAAILAGAVWLAVFAPIVGFAAKGDVNAQSLSDRALATQAGVAALSTHPLGGVADAQQNAINLVAALAPYGLPFFLIVTATVLLPAAWPKTRRGAPTAVLIFVTFLLSQPAATATFVFILLGLGYWVASDRETTKSPLDLPQETEGAGHRSGRSDQHQTKESQSRTSIRTV